MLNIFDTQLKKMITTNNYGIAHDNKINNDNEIIKVIMLTMNSEQKQ